MKLSLEKLLTHGVGEVIEKDHLEKALQGGKKLRIKFGVDPTAPDLHLGHTVPLRKLRQFQDAGHKAVLIIGDFTAKIGDPSGRDKTRPQLSEKEIKVNAKTYFEQAKKILDVKKVEIRYNSEWFKKGGWGDVIQLTSKFTAQRILERDDFFYRLNRYWVCPICNTKNIIDPHIKDPNKLILNSNKCRKCRHDIKNSLPGHFPIMKIDEDSIGVHELLYPIMQAYDSVMVKADVEIGGTDQKFNMLAGRDLQRHLGLPEQDVITLPLLVGLDGVKKMSKSYGNYIGITEAPNVKFGKIMAVPDELINQYYELCTDEKRTISDSREAKLELGKIIVGMYHGLKAGEKAKEEFIRVFSKHEAPTEIKKIKVKMKNPTLVDLLLETKMASSRGEARRLVEQGGVKINNEKQSDSNKVIKLDKELLLQVGKKRFLKLK